MISKASAPPVVAGRNWLDLSLRLGVTASLLGGYYLFRDPLGDWYTHATGANPDPATPRVVLVLALLGLLALVWRRVLLYDVRFQAPFLVTAILALGDASFNILESFTAPSWLVSLTGGMVTGYSPTYVAILATMLAEMLIGRFYYGKWPHLASAYISGISVGILIKSPLLWPFVLCGLISIVSKYVLRIGNRHLWNPTNFGVTMMLLLAPAYVASLSVEAGNNGWSVLAIWVLGSLIMYRLGRFHIPLAFALAFVPLSFLRCWVTDQPWQTEIAPITSPMFQLYIFFMITDPKTTTRARWSQTLVAVSVAAMETFLRLAFKDIHSLYHALFIVGPATNLVEMYADRRRANVAPPVSVGAATALPQPATPGAGVLTSPTDVSPAFQPDLQPKEALR